MQEIINRLIASNFAEFEGLEVSGAVPLRDSFLNETIATFLQSMSEPDDSEPSDSASDEKKDSPSPDIKELLKMVRKVEVQSETGAVVVRFEVKR